MDFRNIKTEETVMSKTDTCYLEKKKSIAVKTLNISSTFLPRFKCTIQSCYL